MVGLRFDRLPAWIVEWSRVDPSLLSVVDLNRDGILQLGELRINGDILVLAAPDIGGMPFVVSCLVAAGALAAALSTADGLLLTTSNALTHDLYFSLVDPGASPTRRVAISKVVLMVVAPAGAYIATRKPATILHLVTPVFSIAAATLFPRCCWACCSAGSAQPLGRLRRHARRPGRDAVLPRRARPAARRLVRRCLARAAVVGHPGQLRRRVRRAGGLRGTIATSLVDAGAGGGLGPGWMRSAGPTTRLNACAVLHRTNFASAAHRAHFSVSRLFPSPARMSRATMVTPAFFSTIVAPAVPTAASGRRAAADLRTPESQCRAVLALGDGDGS